jgi:hypothetical protein
MKKYYNIGIGIEILSAIIYLVHWKFRPLGSDFMFFVLIIASFTSIFLFWQSSKNISIVGFQKKLGVACACLPLVFCLSMIYYFVFN